MTRSQTLRVTLLVLASNSPALAQSTMRVSVSSQGLEASNNNQFAALSADGAFAAFASPATNLVPGDTNDMVDVFVRDIAAGVTVRASVSGSGIEGDGISWDPDLSADGRYVAFATSATNLIATDTNSLFDVLVRDMQTGQLQHVSLSSAGAQGNRGCYRPSISADGNVVVFRSDASNLVAGYPADFHYKLFAHDCSSGVTTLITLGLSGTLPDDHSDEPRVSGDGRYVSFASAATNLVAGDTNGVGDTFLYDRQLGTTTLVSVDSSGAQGNWSSGTMTAISADGRYVAFSSGATNLVPGDTNGALDVFVRDLLAGTTSRVSLDSSNAQANSWSDAPSISADGRYVAFTTNATNLFAGDTNAKTDIVLRDRQAGTTVCVSRDGGVALANDWSTEPSISADGTRIEFRSAASNLVPNDLNHAPDVFVRDVTPLQCATVATYCVSKHSSQGCWPALTTTGTCSASAGSGFTIDASSILPNKSGLFLYSVVGPASAIFQGGKLCAHAPLRRTPTQLSGGAAACSGTFSIDFNARIASGVDPALVGGAQFWGQYWYRDPQDFFNIGLTHAVTAVICP